MNGIPYYIGSADWFRTTTIQKQVFELYEEKYWFIVSTIFEET